MQHTSMAHVMFLLDSAGLEPWIVGCLMMLVPGVPLDSVSLKNRSGECLIYYQQSCEGKDSFTLLPTYSAPSLIRNDMHSDIRDHRA